MKQKKKKTISDVMHKLGKRILTFEEEKILFNYVKNKRRLCPNNN